MLYNLVKLSYSSIIINIFVDIGLNYKEKVELFKYKRNHNDLDWESEVMRRNDQQSRRIDLERLRKMANDSSNHRTKSNVDSNNVNS